MFSRQLDRLSRSLSFRLNLWHAAVFILSTCLLYVVLYFLLSLAVDQKDREAIESQLKEYALAYQGGGLVSLRNFVRANEMSKKHEPSFVYVVHPQLGLVFANVPQALACGVGAVCVEVGAGRSTQAEACGSDGTVMPRVKRAVWQPPSQA